jgi:uncharacterized protein YeeX (DUF496 family)
MVNDNLKVLQEMKKKSDHWRSRLDENLNDVRQKYYHQVDRLIDKMRSDYGEIIEDYEKKNNEHIRKYQDQS